MVEHDARQCWRCCRCGESDCCQGGEKDVLGGLHCGVFPESAAEASAGGVVESDSFPALLWRVLDGVGWAWGAGSS